MSEKKRCKPKKCVVCGRPTCHICCSLITKQFISEIAEVALEKLIEEDRKLQGGIEDDE